jgi:phage terminase large subunit-like protein
MSTHKSQKPGKRYPAPVALFPLLAQPTSALDMIPITPDPTGRGARAWTILSRLPITEGEHACKRIGENAPPWQERLTRLLFGHTDEAGLRVLREAFVTLGKKNSKTTYAAALALVKLLLEEDTREQVLFLAANRNQARIAFDAMSAMIRSDAELASRFEIIDYRHTIRYLATNSQARAIAADMASVVGFNPSFAVVDELHLLGATPKGAKLASQLRTGSVARREPLILSISTKPTDRGEGIFQATYDKAKRIIAGKEVDPRFFAWLCEIPEELDPEDPSNWHWSNPSLGFTVTLARLRSDYESAKFDPAALRDFRSQNLNISPEDSAGEGRWMALATWDSAADDTIDSETVISESRQLYLGIDAGGLDDLSAAVVLGKTKDGDILVFSHQWISRQGFNKRSSVIPYADFLAAGELSVFDNGSGDIQAIGELARELAETKKLSLIGIDAYGAAELAEALQPCGVEVVSVPQGWRIAPAISWIERRLADGTLRHHGSRLLRLNVGNAVVSKVGNARSISKATAVGSGKIDGVAALLNATAACIAREAKPERQYQLFFV